MGPKTNQKWGILKYLCINFSWKDKENSGLQNGILDQKLGYDINNNSIIEHDHHFKFTCLTVNHP